MLTQLSSVITGLMFGWAMVQQCLPDSVRQYMDRFSERLLSFVDPYIRITFHECTGQYLRPNKAYSAIREYLSANSTGNSKRLQADLVKGKQPLAFSMDDYEEVVDHFNGVKVWWTSKKTVPRAQLLSFQPTADERRYYQLKFHKCHREIITKLYIDHVLKEGKAIKLKNKVRKLYTNNPSDSLYEGKWSHVTFEHPATFDTLAMKRKKKEEIMNDLIKFSNGKEYYAKMGKAWKRGYLLYGPPGTGKSTLIAAMANFLCYDVYDLELTTVKDNTELRKLLIETTSKSIIVIEDIDCTIDLTGKREEGKENKHEMMKHMIWKKKKEEVEDRSNQSKLTLSGLLNSIDGIWSACGRERIIVFTTNHVDKLDPALVRRGRMDKHIEMSYCCFEAFKVLAKNYLDIESHELFGTVENLWEINMSPADVAENLMPKSDGEDVETCLKNLISALSLAKMTYQENIEEGLKAEKKKNKRGWLIHGWKVKGNGVFSLKE